MTRIAVSTIALMAALSLPGIAIAQTTGEQQVVPQTEENQAQPKAPDAAAPAATQAEQEAQPAEVVAAAPPPKGLITMQDANAFLASDLTAATVYSPSDETIGDVNDVIIARDGKIQGIVVGVGGFLGIGEKDVAIEMSQIQMMETEAGAKLVLSATKDQLAAAPEFKSKATMKAELEAAQPTPTPAPIVPDPAQPQQQQ